MDFAWTNGDSFRRVRWTEALPFYLVIALVTDTEYCVKKKKEKRLDERATLAKNGGCHKLRGYR